MSELSAYFVQYRYLEGVEVKQRMRSSLARASVRVLRYSVSSPHLTRFSADLIHGAVQEPRLRETAGRLSDVHRSGNDGHARHDTRYSLISCFKAVLVSTLDVSNKVLVLTKEVYSVFV
jgi:hypothetical protein